MYKQLNFSLPPMESVRLMSAGSRTEGRELRKYLARVNTSAGLDLPPWFFGYGENGEVDPTLKPAIAMSRIDDGVFQIAGIGPLASVLLADKAEGLLNHLKGVVRGEVRMQLSSGEHVLASHGRRHYLVPQLVLGRTTRYNNWWRRITEVEEAGGWSEASLAYLGWFMAQGIKSQFEDLIAQGDTVHGDLAEWLVDLMQSQPDKVAVLNALEARLGLQVEGVRAHSGVRSTGPQGKRVMLKGILFSMNAEMTGPWIVGRNRIEGFGQIRPWVVSKQARIAELMEMA